MEKMHNISRILNEQGPKPVLRQLCGRARWGLPFIAVLFLLLTAPLTHAQTTAQLTGSVQDPSGAMIPGAQVTLTDESTGTLRVVQTNRQGL
jgi:hypothetical protein